MLETDHPLVLFLNARFNDDERYAHDAMGLLGIVRPWYTWPWLKDALPGVSRAACRHIERQSPKRALSEVAAKRRILSAHGKMRFGGSCLGCEEPLDLWPCVSVRAIASVYADHPDYQEEWGSVL